MKLGWKARADIVLMSAMILGASALLPAYWLDWPSPASKAAMIGVGWIVLSIGLTWASKADDCPHTILLFRTGLLHHSRTWARVLEIILVGAFLWLILY